MAVWRVKTNTFYRSGGETKTMVESVIQDEGFSGTKPVDERNRMDVAKLDAWMDGNVEGYKGPLSILQFKGGQSRTGPIGSIRKPRPMTRPYSC